MTIAISLKVNDGVVLAADSASTLMAKDGIGNIGVFNVYNNANKVFNLRKGLPIGMVTFGQGAIGTASISTLAKDLRRRLHGEDIGHTDWHLRVDEPYTMQEVAERVKEYMFTELYEPAFADWAEKPTLGFIVSGYSSGEDMAEEYQILIEGGICNGPTPVRARDEIGVIWQGQPEAISRLIMGFSPLLPLAMEQQLGVPPEQIAPAIAVLQQSLKAPLVMPAMPFQDAIDLAEFLVDLTIRFTRFMPGAQTVGGPIEVAAISKHEGFKWIRRKHYYSAILNPEVR